MNNIRQISPPNTITNIILSENIIVTRLPFQSVQKIWTFI